MEAYEEKKDKILRSIKNGLIVSCQAREGWAMYGKDIMAAFAAAALEGGAVGIRANKVENIIAIKKKVNLPIIGINKIWDENYEVYITPTYHSAKEVIEAGADIVAIDGTLRKRPNGETSESIIKEIKTNHPGTIIMADISTFEEGVEAERLGVDLIATTLAGYTPYTNHLKAADFNLIEKLSSLNTPIIAEGKINSKEEAVKALKSGAYAVVVGTAITRPEIITKWYVEEINNYI